MYVYTYMYIQKYIQSHIKILTGSHEAHYTVVRDPRLRFPIDSLSPPMH